MYIYMYIYIYENIWWLMVKQKQFEIWLNIRINEHIAAIFIITI
jgi:hypothetical protein